MCPFPGCTSRFNRMDNCTQHFKTHSSTSVRARNSRKKPEKISSYSPGSPSSASASVSGSPISPTYPSNLAPLSFPAARRPPRPRRKTLPTVPSATYDQEHHQDSYHYSPYPPAHDARLEGRRRSESQSQQLSRLFDSSSSPPPSGERTFTLPPLASTLPVNSSSFAEVNQRSHNQSYRYSPHDTLPEGMEVDGVRRPRPTVDFDPHDDRDRSSSIYAPPPELRRGGHTSAPASVGAFSEGQFGPPQRFGYAAPVEGNFGEEGGEGPYSGSEGRPGTGYESLVDQYEGLSTGEPDPNREGLGGEEWNDGERWERRNHPEVEEAFHHSADHRGSHSDWGHLPANQGAIPSSSSAAAAGSYRYPAQLPQLNLYRSTEIGSSQQDYFSYREDFRSPHSSSSSSSLHSPASGLLDSPHHPVQFVSPTSLGDGIPPLTTDPSSHYHPMEPHSYPGSGYYFPSHSYPHPYATTSTFPSAIQPFPSSSSGAFTEPFSITPSVTLAPLLFEEREQAQQQHQQQQQPLPPLRDAAATFSTPAEFQPTRRYSALQ